MNFESFNRTMKVTTALLVVFAVALVAAPGLPFWIRGALGLMLHSIALMVWGAARLPVRSGGE